MPKIRFLATWCSNYQKLLNIPRGYIVFRYNEFYRKSLSKVLLKIDGWQNKRKEKFPNDFLKSLEIEIEYHYRKRTLDQNNLMWLLYTIEANEANGGQSGSEEQLVAPEELYLNDLYNFGEREIINTKRKNLGYYLGEYKIIEMIITDEGKEFSLKKYLKLNINNEERMTIRVIRGSSKFSTLEMSQWVDRLFNRLAHNGVQVTNPGEIENYWHTWKMYLNENKIILNDKIMTQKEYKNHNPICEACGKYIQHGNGELAHIKSVGMGVDRNKEPYYNYPFNWLHLCAHPCHRKHWHEWGVKKFIQKYKHLEYKIKFALENKLLKTKRGAKDEN